MCLPTAIGAFAFSVAFVVCLMRGLGLMESGLVALPISWLVIILTALALVLDAYLEDDNEQDS